MKKNHLILILAFTFFLNNNASAQTQTYQWSAAFGSTANDIGYAVVTDASGNSYSTGFFSGTMDADPSAGVTLLASNGQEDVFITCYDEFGSFLWAKSFGGSGGDIGYSIGIDGTGNVIVCGVVEDTVDFDPGSGTATVISQGSTDLFLAKYDSQGNYIWAFSLGAPSDFNDAKDLCIDANENIYITGSFRSTLDFDPGSGIYNISSAGQYDSYFAKYTSAGAFVSAFAFGGSGTDRGLSAELDNTGFIIVSGYFSFTADLDAGIDSFNVTSVGGFDLFVVKYDTAGVFQWGFGTGDVSDDEAKCVDVDNSNNIYVAGYFFGNVDFEPGSGQTNILSSPTANSSFIVKYTSSGVLDYVKGINGAFDNTAYAINADDYFLKVAGSARGTTDFDPGSAVDTLTPVNARDIYAVRLDASSGFYDGTVLIGGTGQDDCYGLAWTSSGHLVLCGLFGGTADFDNGPLNTATVSQGLVDVFLASYFILTPGFAEYAFGNFTIYPNPATETITLKGEGNIFLPKKISLCNIIGEVLQSNSALSLSKSIQFSLKDIKPGVYFLKLEPMNEKMEIVRFVKL